jgi:glycine/D-amino acid oxidase-like deaminating enzyme
VIVTTPVRPAAPGPRPLGYLHQGYDYFRWLGDRLLIGGGRHRFGSEENDTTSLTPTPVVREYLVGVARRVIGHADFDVAAHWAGIMGFPGGRHIGAAPRQPVDGVTEAVAGFGGMGVALTPAVAEEIAGEFLA